MYRKVSRQLLRRIRGIGWNFLALNHLMLSICWNMPFNFLPQWNGILIMSYAAFDHLTLNFHQALEYYLFMAFILHLAAVRWKALLILGIKKISLISKLTIRNSGIMPIDDKVFSNHRGAQHPSIQVKTWKSPKLQLHHFCPTARANS